VRSLIRNLVVLSAPVSRQPSGRPHQPPVPASGWL